MKQLALLLFLLLSTAAISQVTFAVDDFSEKYYGEVFIADTSAVFSEGWVAIYDKKTKAEIIKIHSEELTHRLHKGQMLANIKELPYGEQSQILYEDYNFDGEKDFAIMDGQNSCYHGPSFQIYLATNQGLKHSPSFTKLAQEYCGMFDLDPTSKTIYTMTKSGCCWHQYTAFKVKDNTPYPIKIVEESMHDSAIAWDYVEENLVNGKMVKSTYQILATESIEKDDFVLSFELENKKKMQIFHTEDVLYYVFSDSEEKIELLYRDDFKYSSTENSLSFSNHNVRYVIDDEKITVITPNKTHIMKSAPSTRSGTLEKLKNLQLENLTK